MKINRRFTALLLCAALLLSLAGCTAKPDETAAPTTQPPTEPPTTAAPTEPPAEDLYAQARTAIDEAPALDLNVTASRTRSVGGEIYTENATQMIRLRNIGTEQLQAAVQDSTTVNTYVMETREYFTGGTVWMQLDSLYYTAAMEAEDYLRRLVPAVLLDAQLYNSVTAEETPSGYSLTFSEPSAGESWLVPENAELLSAGGTATLDAQGRLAGTAYTVSYRYGSTTYDTSYTVSVTVPEAAELENPITAAQEEFVTVEYIDAPWLLQRAAYDILQTQNLSYTSTDTMISYAGGVIFSQQETLDLYGTGTDTMSNYTVDISLQDYSGTIDEYKLEENVQDGILKYFENDDNPTAQKLTDSMISELRGAYVDVVLDFLWEPRDLTSATITDLGSVLLLEFEGNDALGDVYEAAAVSTFWGDENFLRDLADGYHTDTLKGYLSIDRYSELPVAFGFTYEGTHTLEGQDFQLTDQWDQTFFLGSNTAYEAITEEPLPDVEPETKPTPLFYHVTGENGQEMWLIGTIHVGDDRTGFLPQEIYDALLSSDALAVEFDSEAFDEALENDDNLVSQIQSCYFYADGSQTKDHLDQEIYDLGVQLLKATGNYFTNAEYLKPYLWSQSIENFMLRQGYDLVSEKGVDNRLMDMARENDIEIRDIESGLFQISMLTGYSEKLQELLLEDALYTDSAEYCAGVRELYELWCAGDEAALREELSDEVDTSEFTEEELAEYEEQKPYIEEYNKAMSYDRNDGMLDAAIEYLESGETVFYAVGLAHLLNNVNGLVDTLREAGYTVELVSYGS